MTDGFLPRVTAPPEARKASHSKRVQGKYMANTIELLETIGRDASLRHASGEDLLQALTGLQASDALKQAVISGDDGHLMKELGHRDVKTPDHVNNNDGGGHDDHDSDGDHDGNGQTGFDGDDKATEEIG